MKTESQTRGADLDRLCSLIAHIPVAVLTTLDGSGALFSRPMAVLEVDSNGALWFFTDMRLAKIGHFGLVSLTFTDPDHSGHVSVSGRGEIHADAARVQRLWSASVRPWFPDGPDSPHLALLKVVPDSAEYWDAQRGRMFVIAVAAAAEQGAPNRMAQPAMPTPPLRL